ncbi:LysR family transcriptional regulator [Lysobacter sp. TY2-98]|uniref:LysR family transcriptional regulator n=1 Tax=Lysobacter sp. TY2-98 TaxID=2290922 RepID=UPI000E201A87|nr:LysR family transcriptional regulator [Lysobacter sp. TY2-98]AXK73107.1 LysR family transcriptional regulator [Lysobacter sp. TY2-98]
MAVFAAVLDAGGFTAAGGRLGLTKGAVSKAVGRLERHLGTRLLNRTTRRVAATEAGDALLAYCRTVVQQADAAEQHLGVLRDVPRGLLRITATISFGVARVSPLLTGLVARHPDVQVALRLDDTVADLVGDRFDLAIRIGRLPDSGLVARRLGAIHGSVVASPDYLARRGTPHTPADLVDHDCLRYDEHARTWSVPGLELPIGRGIAVDNTLGQLQVALAGGGLALLADYIAEPHVQSGALVRVLADDVRSRIDVHALHPYARTPPQKVTAAIAYFAECLAT